MAKKLRNFDIDKLITTAWTTCIELVVELCNKFQHIWYNFQVNKTKSLIACWINDSTNILMYAGWYDTKIWRGINHEIYHHILQKDIDYLYDWALKNGMTFHPSKCKVLMVSRLKIPLLNILPFVPYVSKNIFCSSRDIFIKKLHFVF